MHGELLREDKPCCVVCLGLSPSPSPWTLMRPRTTLKWGVCTCWDTVSAPKCFQMQQQQMLPRLTLTWLSDYLIFIFTTPVLSKTSVLSLVSLRVSSGNAHLKKTRIGGCTPCPSPDNFLSQFLMAHSHSSLQGLSLSPLTDKDFNSLLHSAYRQINIH